MLDGFAEVTERDLHTGSILNLAPYVDTYSPFSAVHTITPSTSERLLVDTFYGLVYREWIERGGSPYGITAHIPLPSFASGASAFVRTPFALVPRFPARDGIELRGRIAELQSALPELTLLFRGQTRLYTLDRGAETLERLYGEPVIEPSLLSSAERHRVNIDQVGPTWSGALRHLLDLVATALHDDDLFRHYGHLGQSYDFRQIALALAQHYGLPSSGLDVTTRLEVALYFALNRLVRAGDTRLRSERVGTGDHPILYVFGMENSSQFQSFDADRFRWSWPNRPVAQAACFLSEGWGLARNRAAQSLLAVFDLDASADYSPVADSPDLFPDATKDLMGAALDSLRHHLSTELPQLGAFLQHFYWVEHA